MLLLLSSKGQSVIPKTIREVYILKMAINSKVKIVDGMIILDPVAKGLVEKLYGKYAGQNMLAALEEEHRQELENER